MQDFIDVCFNPCYVGLGIRTIEPATIGYLGRGVSILVMLDWV